MSVRPWSVVSFDAGGTLLEPWPSVGEVYAAGAAQAGYPGLDPATLNQRFVRAWKSSAGFDYSRAAWRGLVADTFAGSMPDPANPDLFAELYDRFARPGAWRVFDDVPVTLRRLRAAGYRLVVTSNWDERLRPLLTALGLVTDFELVVASSEWGWHKPDRRLFAAVADRLQVPAGEIIHVGDSHREDVAGAEAAGWSARWLRRHHSLDDVGSGALRTLDELLSNRVRS